ncbi:hypothetical protein LL254_04095 [Marinobacter nauticus]|uniref:hypothetical protein n=1 Tax=Marinobacter nauticus TaxID=2743 RepID=UPI001D198332|nr:hypothetical protein [Marinobacter nauticus]MCC4269878.1 hypothetical protein [Marinobacter nauticus]
MPRAKDNRKAVGTEHCSECGTLARFYQVQKGNRTGYLYRRCECGADQRTGAGVQVKWLESMQRTGETMIPHPLEQVRDAQPEPEEPEEKPEPETPEPSATSEGNPKTENKRAGLIGLAAMAGAVAVALFT